MKASANTLDPQSEKLLKLARSFQAKKRLGQHFLFQHRDLSSICDALALTKDDKVLEIGPGIGFLTNLLCSRAQEVTAVELDRECIEYLKTLKLPNLSIKHGDFLQYEIESGRFRHGDSRAWSSSATAESGAEDHDRFQAANPRLLKVAGNVPYQITGLIIGRLLGEIDQAAAHLKLIDSIVLTVQKEVGERIVAFPGTKAYGQLSLLISYYCRAEIVRYLPASHFYPAPKVDSCIVKLTPLKEPRVSCSNPRLLRRIIKTGFSQRRKMLRNSLVALGRSQDSLNRVFADLNFDPQLRAEVLSLEQFALLSEALSEAGEATK